VLCDKRKEHVAEISLGDVHFHMKCPLKVTHPFLKNADFYQYLLMTSQP